MMVVLKYAKQPVIVNYNQLTQHTVMFFMYCYLVKSFLHFIVFLLFSLSNSFYKCNLLPMISFKIKSLAQSLRNLNAKHDEIVSIVNRNTFVIFRTLVCGRAKYMVKLSHYIFQHLLTIVFRERLKNM
jgi:hypothetical protein